MPHVNPLTHSFVPIVFMVLMSTLTGIGVIVLSWFAGGGRTSHAGETVYECGLDPMDPTPHRFPVQFYVVAMLFILFDVEIALLYPWAVAFGSTSGTPALRLFLWAELMVFLALLGVGYVYLLRIGAFDWVKGVRRQKSMAGDARRAS